MIYLQMHKSTTNVDDDSGLLSLLAVVWVASKSNLCRFLMSGTFNRFVTMLQDSILKNRFRYRFHHSDVHLVEAENAFLH